MTAPAATALAFAKECLGWRDAELNATAECVYRRGAHVTKRLHFTDLNSVTATVRQWCGTDHACLTIEYSDGAFDVLVVLIGSSLRGDATHRNLAHALLTACLSAQRQPKATA